VTQQETAQLIAYLRAVMPHQRGLITKETILAYADALADVPFVDCIAAAKRHVAISPYLPSVSDLLGQLAEQDTDIPPAEQAWEQVMAAIRNWGYYRPWVFDNPVLQRSVDSIGKDTFCLSEEIGVERAHFMRVYESYRQRVMREARQAKMLPGTVRKQLEAQMSDPSAKKE